MVLSLFLSSGSLCIYLVVLSLCIYLVVLSLYLSSGSLSLCIYLVVLSLFLSISLWNHSISFLCVCFHVCPTTLTTSHHLRRVSHRSLPSPLYLECDPDPCLPSHPSPPSWRRPGAVQTVPAGAAAGAPPGARRLRLVLPEAPGQRLPPARLGQRSARPLQQTLPCQQPQQGPGAEAAAQQAGPRQLPQPRAPPVPRPGLGGSGQGGGRTRGWWTMRQDLSLGHRLLWVFTLGHPQNKNVASISSNFLKCQYVPRQCVCVCVCVHSLSSHV